MVSIGRERNEISGSVYGEEDFEWLCNCQFLIVVIVPYGHKNTMLCFFQQSRNRPSVAQRVPGALGSQISMTFGT